MTGPGILKAGSGRALVETGMTAVLWGTSFPVVNLGLRSGMDPWTFVFLRFAAAAPIMLVAVYILGGSVRGSIRGRPVWTLGILNTIGFACQFVGQQYTQASVAALLVNLSVVLAAAGSALFLGERLGRVKLLGILAAVSGTVMITTNGSLAALTAGQVLGDSLYLVAAVSWAGYIVYAKKLTEGNGDDPHGLAAGVVVVTAVLTAPMGFISGLGVPSVGAFEAIVYTAVLNTAVPFFLYQRGLRHLTASTSAMVLMLEIVVAVAISAAFLGEELSNYALVGGAAVLVSVLLVSGLELGSKSLSVGRHGTRRVRGPP